MLIPILSLTNTNGKVLILKSGISLKQNKFVFPLGFLIFLIIYFLFLSIQNIVLEFFKQTSSFSFSYSRIDLVIFPSKYISSSFSSK